MLLVVAIRVVQDAPVVPSDGEVGRDDGLADTEAFGAGVATDGELMRPGFRGCSDAASGSVCIGPATRSCIWVDTDTAHARAMGISVFSLPRGRAGGQGNRRHPAVLFTTELSFWRKRSLWLIHIYLRWLLGLLFRSGHDILPICIVIFSLYT